jgi:hypothetical protein
MRVETLSRAEVVGPLNEHFVVAWSNLVPELYGNADPNAPPPPSYNPEHARSMPEGGGGGNIRVYFCTPDGLIVHQVVGFWKAERFVEEVEFARGLLPLSPDEVRARQAARREEIAALRTAAGAEVPAEAARNDPRARRFAALSLRLRAADELLGDLFADVGDVLDRRHEEVYTKGAVG